MVQCLVGIREVILELGVTNPSRAEDGRTEDMWTVAMSASPITPFLHSRRLIECAECFLNLLAGHVMTSRRSIDRYPMEVPAEFSRSASYF